MQATREASRLGFTVIELLVTIAVASILLALGVPAFNDLMAKTRTANAANALLGHLQYARSEAIKRGRDRVAVGPATGDVWRSSQSWDGGYLVADVDSASPPGILKVLRRVEATELAVVTITMNGTNPRVIFLPDGSSSVQATLTVCYRADPSYKPRAVIVDSVGRVRVSDYASGGSNLTCP